ncbi:heavy metal translocating P-type ATPase [Facilibium subflavum]|uniref:heavy metal translocating P-type ATPase n=1 Tax=Facilibium subflavum TaxID=2219058 RepID=UPI000E65DBD9|nr:heavy metal translocating P-type ATPase [Facilibium subflavum]
MRSENTHFTFKLHNVSCASCVKHIEKALDKENIDQVAVNFAQRTLEVDTSLPADDIIKILKKAGYEATRQDEENNHHDHHGSHTDKKQLEKQLAKVIISGALGVIMLVLAWLPSTPGLMDTSGYVFWLVMALITTIALFYSASHIYKGAYKALLKLTSTMDTLIAVGTLAAWGYSIVVILWPGLFPDNAREIYFDAALIIVALVNLGSLLESKARGKTSQAIEKLIALQPKTAVRINDDGQEEKVEIKAIKLKDKIKVRPGENIAVDGVVIEGHSYVDESMLTGEPVPVAKKEKSEVFAGTLNKKGSFVFEVKKIGKETALSNIIDLVQKAQATKPPIARLADTVAAYFVPAVLMIAIITALIWIYFGFSAAFVLVASVSVLVIACPCALGLATPISVIVGMGRAAQSAILIRDGQALQVASKIDTIILDKTGTITKGAPEVVDTIEASQVSKEAILKVAASLEQYSEHPLAQAIVKKAQSMSIAIEKAKDFESESGFGVKGVLHGEPVYLGNKAWLEKNNIQPGNLAQKAEAFASHAQTPIYVAKDGKVLGIIAIADPVKEDAKKSIKVMQNLGIQVMMITGDIKGTALAIAKEVGIDQVIADVLPADKAKEIEKLQQKGQLVAMVGDGINDAPALAQSDIGFAIGSGTDVAIQSAKVTLMQNSLMGVSQAVAVSKATMRNIKQNLFGAFIYNIIGIPIAAGVLFPVMGILLSPMIAGAAMAASSLTVVLNANRLRIKKI